MARLTAHLSKTDGATYRYLRCEACEPSCVPLGAVSLEEAEDALAKHSIEIHGRKPRARRSTNEKLIEAFIDSRRAQGCSEGTIRYYDQALRAFSKHVGAKTFSRLRRTDVEGFLVANKEWADASVAKHLRILRTFIAWAQESKFDVPDFCGSIRAPKLYRRTVEALSPEQLSALLKAARLLTQYPWLWVAANLAVHGGLSLGDIQALDWLEVLWKDQRIVRTRQKSKRPLDFPISPGLRLVLEQLRGEDPAISGPVCRGCPDSDSGVSKGVRSMYALAKVPRLKGQGLHFLRTSFVSLAIEKTADIAAVAEIVGDDPATVAKYYTKSREARRAAVIAAVDKALATA